MTRTGQIAVRRPVRQRSRRPFRVGLAWAAGWALMALAVAGLRGEERSPGRATVRIHIGIGPGSWQGLNRNDATAAIATWARMILRQRGAELDVACELFDSEDELGNALRRKQIDAASMLAQQFVAVEAEFKPASIFVTTREGSITERYVLVVRRDSGIDRVAALRGRALTVQSNTRASLTLPWIETLLAGGTAVEADQFFGSVTRGASPSKMVLQVFFRQADAAIVTANALAVASELNPQLQRELRVLATSPEVIPALFFFRADFDPARREQMEQAMRELRDTPAGSQVLTVFQGDGIAKLPPSALETTRALLTAHARAEDLAASREDRLKPALAAQASMP